MRLEAATQLVDVTPKNAMVFSGSFWDTPTRYARHLITRRSFFQFHNVSSATAKQMIGSFDSTERCSIFVQLLTTAKMDYAFGVSYQ